MRICGRCGRTNADDCEYCEVCGNPLNVNYPPQTVQNMNSYNPYPPQYQGGIYPLHKDYTNMIMAIIASIGCFITIISTFLPYMVVKLYGTTIADVKMTDSGKDGPFFIGLSIAALVFLLVSLSNGGRFSKGASVVFSVLQGFLLIAEIANDNDIIDDTLGGYRSIIEHGSGFYLLIVGTILLVIGCIVNAVHKQ